MTRNIITPLFLALICALPVSAQTGSATVPPLPGNKKCTAAKPKLLQKDILNYSDLLKEFRPGTKWGQDKTIKAHWLVYSDREQNQTYMQPNTSSQKCVRLGFNDPLRIAKIENDMALVYVEPDSPDWPTIGDRAQCRGWVPMENLLLWDTCPTDNRGVLQKALISFNLNVQQSEMRGKYYHSPDNHDNPQELQMDMNFYYVMKEDKHAEQALLCTRPTLSATSLFGWVSKKYYTPWNQRTCLEPNWDPAYVEANRNEIAYVYGSDKLIGGDELTNWKFGKENGDVNRSTKYRMPAAQLRFPILDQPNDRSIKCTVFADRRGNINDVAQYSATGITGFNESKQQKQNLNIIFVVEGTSEMSKYFPSVKQAISDMKSIVDPSWNVKIGAVIYRGENADIEYAPLSKADDPALLNMFNPQKANGTPSGTNRSVAISKGINAATDANKMGLNKNENNLVIIIGNRGAAPNDKYLESPELLKRLTDNNIQMMSIQVMRNGSGSWAYYDSQIPKLIEENVKKQYSSMGHVADYAFASREKTDGYIFKNTTGNNYIYASYRYGKMEVALTPTTVTQFITTGIGGFSKIVKNQIQEFAKAENGIDFDERFIEKQLGQEVYKRWKNVKAISAYNGYAKLKDTNGNDYWHYVLYLNTTELNDLISKLRDVNEAASHQNKDRKIFLDAMRQLVKAQLGKDKGKNVTDKYVDEMSAEDLQEIIYGLNVKTESMNRYSLKDIKDKLTDDQYFDLLTKFSEKYARLTRHRQSYKYKLDIDDVSYYWIPIEDLP